MTSALSPPPWVASPWLPAMASKLFLLPPAALTSQPTSRLLPDLALALRLPLLPVGPSCLLWKSVQVASPKSRLSVDLTSDSTPHMTDRDQGHRKVLVPVMMDDDVETFEDDEDWAM